MRKNIIITGGAGYIGQALSWYLYKKNYLPIIIDRSSKKKIIKNKQKYGKVFNINIRDIDKILRRYKCDTIIHCASNNIVWESKNNPIKYYKSNVSDTIDMLCKAVKYKVKKIIYASSSSVYGSLDLDKKIDEKTFLNPSSCYGRTKKINEDIIKDFSNSYGFKYVFLRLFNVSGAILKNDFKHGPKKNSTTAIARAVTWSKNNNNKKYIITSAKTNKTSSKNTPVRDFTHVLDIAQAFYKSVVYLNKYKKNNIFNIGSGSNGTNVLDLIKKIEKDLKIKINYSISKKIDEINFMVPNINKAKKKLNYNPVNSSLGNIIESLDEWYKKI